MVQAGQSTDHDDFPVMPVSPCRFPERLIFDEFGCCERCTQTGLAYPRKPVWDFQITLTTPNTYVQVGLSLRVAKEHLHYAKW
ncbi:hypothetical protein K443DRAFT_678307 [Laccaria amethystina LaAM-08-1]|uniref:Uncharacterized protein n=1 Tax=Laccaria amethystina LaAM-08-1 TaxID=1095629 RepID=A0A0C9WS51_9AGAR|nr:hypothetical protein K443DRAFT_678307 [Laccaria amethystina LaAM-08-1]